MIRYLRFLIASTALSCSAAPSFANFSFSPSGSTTMFAVDVSNQGTALCAAASTECAAHIPINTAGAPIFVSGTPGFVSLNATPTLANGNGVVPTQGGAVLGATNGIYSNILQGNAVLSATNGTYANLLQGNAVLATGNPIFAQITTGAAVMGAVTQSGNWTSRIVGNIGGVLDFAGQNATSPANAMLMGAQFNTSPTTISAGNVSPLQLDNAGNLLVNIKAGAGSGGTAIADKAAWTVSSTTFTLSGGEFTTGGATACTTGQACTFATTAGRGMFTDMNTWAETSLGVPTPYGTQPTTGNYIGVNAFVTNATTALADNSDAVSTVSTASNSPVNNYNYLFNGSTFDRQRSGGVTGMTGVSLQATPSGAATITSALAPATPAGVNLKASAGTVYGIHATTIQATPVYVKLYNASSAPTCGSGTPVARFMVPANATAADGAGTNISFPVGIAFGTGIGYCVTGALPDADTTAITVNNTIVNISWN